MSDATTQQYSFRLPKDLISRLDGCMATMRDAGLELTRADVVRLLLNHALETTKCDLAVLLAPRSRMRR